MHLQLLNEELKDLWFDDLEIYNGLQNKRFRMQVVLLWSITDFQYMLSFRKVILACHAVWMTLITNGLNETVNKYIWDIAIIWNGTNVFDVIDNLLIVSF